MSATAPAVDHDVRTAIEATLRRQLTERTPDEQQYGAEFSRLWRLTAQAAGGGKLLRPRLLVETHAALSSEGGTVVAPDTVLEVAAFIEQLHFAFLLHDDIIDGDLRRRGTANLIGILSDVERHEPESSEARLHWARSSALLMGDLLLTSATLGIAKADLPHGIRTRLLDLLDLAVTETVAGEHIDVGLGDGILRPDLSTVLAMTASKTAAYSFELPLRCAAILAGATAEVETALIGIGRHLGLAYQLQDDLLSVFGDSASHGKESHSDLREAKETALIAYARATSTWPMIAARFGAPDLLPHEGAEIARLLRHCGAESFVSRLVDDQLVAAGDLLASAAGTLPPEALARLHDLITRIEGRRA